MKTQTVDLFSLKPHPDNYRNHPQDQIEEIKLSIEEHGIYRPVVVSADNVILAGHGITEAARQLGYEKIPIFRIDIQSFSDQAIKILLADNLLSTGAEDDDRKVVGLLDQLADLSKLSGVGMNVQQLAAWKTVIAPPDSFETETDPFDAQEEWESLGMPDYEPGRKKITLVVHFDSEEERDEFIDQQGFNLSAKSGQTWSTWWPPREKKDLSSVLWE